MTSQIESTAFAVGNRFISHRFISPRKTRVLRTLWAAALCGLLLWSMPVHAQEVAQAALPDTTAPETTGWMNTPGVTPDQVNEVAREIWCPLCSGVRLDSCELRACDQMKDVIAIKLAEGDNSAEIKDYFLAQYGPQILGEPPREGFNWLAWILPVVAVTGGGLFLWRQARRLVRPPTTDAERLPAAAGEQVDDTQTTNPDASPAPLADSQALEQQAAERRLEEELARYD